jgi:hypothetical protein
MKSKLLLIGTVALATSMVFAAPVQAHDNDLWPLYGLTGLILLDSYSHNHRHHRHYYYDAPRYRHEHRRDYSYGRPGKYRHRHNDRDWDRHR